MPQALRPIIKYIAKVAKIGILQLLIMSRRQLGSLIDEITRNQRFVSEVRRCVEECKNDLQITYDKPTFAFERASKYPWSFSDSALPVEGQQAVEDITDMIASLIDHNLHQILSKEFLNISNEILTIRQEITQFTQDQEKRSLQMKEEFAGQVQSLRKKIVVQQTVNANKQTYFARTRSNAGVNSSQNFSEKNDHKAEIATLRKEIEVIKEEFKKQDSFNHFAEKIIYLQEKIQSEIVNLRVKLEGVRAKTEKCVADLAVQLKENSSKEYIGQEVRRSVKSNLKMYMEEVNKCKTDRAELRQSISRTDRGMQEYLANQLKPLWMLVQDLKKRLSELQRECDMNNQSFLME